MGKLSLRFAIAPERFYLVNPGQSLDVGDRLLAVFSPPTYDAPETVGSSIPARACCSRPIASGPCCPIRSPTRRRSIRTRSTAFATRSSSAAVRSRAQRVP
jgi:hypothetical protein